MPTSNVASELSILHLISDVKFIKYAVDLFDNVDFASNHYLVVGSVNQHRIELDHVEYASHIQDLSKSIEFYRGFDCLIVHSLNQKHRDFIKALQFPNFKIWKGYGKDYYDLIYNDTYQLYLPETRKLQQQLHNFTFKSRLKILGKKLLGINRKQIKARIQYVATFDLFLPIVEEEYTIIKAKYPDFKPSFFGWNYNLSLTGQELHNIEKEVNILVGNSATTTNNHVEVFKQLASFNLESRKVIVPLSYGTGVGAYRDIVIKKGKELLEEKFYPLTGFMSYEEYTSLIGSCSIVIMNHKRQQAAGNIYLMLWKGAKVYMRRDNPLYKNLVQKGLVLFDVEDLTPQNQGSLKPLSTDERERNRKIMEWFLDPIQALKKTEELCLLILKLRDQRNHAGG